MVVESEAKQPAIQGKPEDSSSSSSAAHTKQKRKQYRSKKKKEMKMEDGNRCGLVEYWELPDYMKENEYILGYYRSEWPIARAALSLFSWHNETLNVWTHLLGFLLFLGLTLLHLDRAPPLADILGHLPWLIANSVGKKPVGRKPLLEGNPVVAVMVEGNLLEGNPCWKETPVVAVTIIANQLLLECLCWDKICLELLARFALLFPVLAGNKRRNCLLPLPINVMDSTSGK